MAYLNETEINELVIGLQAKSTVAFSDLYDGYAAALYGVTYKMVQNRNVAEDLLQDAFIKIWKNIDKYDSRKGSLFTWMMNITRNTCKDYFRSNNYKFQIMVSDDDLADMDCNHIPNQVVYQDDSRDLYQSVLTLELKYKEVIDLVYIFGYSHAEVSDMLKIPVGTIKTRSRTALKILRNLYH